MIRDTPNAFEVAKVESAVTEAEVCGFASVAVRTPELRRLMDHYLELRAEDQHRQASVAAAKAVGGPRLAS